MLRSIKFIDVINLKQWGKSLGKKVELFGMQKYVEK